MYDFDGDIVIDGISIKEIGLHDLRKKLAIIPQVIFLIYYLKVKHILLIVLLTYIINPYRSQFYFQDQLDLI